MLQSAHVIVFGLWTLIAREILVQPWFSQQSTKPINQNISTHDNNTDQLAIIEFGYGITYV